MSIEDIERLNSLSKNAIKDIATYKELNELKQLLTLWNESIGYNLLRCLYPSNSVGQLF